MPMATSSRLVVLSHHDHPRTQQAGPHRGTHGGMRHRRGRPGCGTWEDRDARATTQPPARGTSYGHRCEQLRKADMADQQAVLKTNRGDITITLFPNHAPETVANFVGLAEGTKEYRDDAGRSGERFYDGLTFHRVIDGFMIQGGCPLGQGNGGPGYTFKDEPHPELTFDKPYLLAMANAGPGTNGSQFFVTVGATPWLNFKHTIFGEVADQASRDVVDAIATTPTGPGDRPKDAVVIETVEIRES